MRSPYIVGGMTRFQGKTALVTGGAKGIGAATAKRFAASEGATVIVADFDEAAAQETAQEIGGHAVRCDVTNVEDVEAAVAKAVEVGGSLDLLATVAGITRDNLLFKMTDDDWNAVIDTHLKGTFYAVRAAQKHMVEQKSGKIVLVSSVSALGNRGQINYSTAKAGLQGMTQDARNRARAVQRERELRRAGVHRDGDDAGDRRTRRCGLRGVQGARGEGDAAAPRSASPRTSPERSHSCARTTPAT